MSTMIELPAGPVADKERPFTAEPASVRGGRRFAEMVLTEAGVTDDEHIYEVTLVLSELLTNAITHAHGARNVFVRIEVWPRWTCVTVDDCDPDVHRRRLHLRLRRRLRESGRGIPIVRAYSERFTWNQRLTSKAPRAIVSRTGVTLTADDRAILDDLEAGR